MCRFKSSDGVKVSGGYSEFQYILCVGSRFIVIAVVGFVGYSFNTSYVSVQGNRSYERLCRPKFQYILCVGSSIPIFYIALFYSGFNTSYVSVQVIICLGFYSWHSSFNTSYVSVQVSIITNNVDFFDSFNTSYVSVQAIRGFK